jgi:hypothetical protein
MQQYRTGLEKDDFADLIEITAHWIGIPAAAVKRDYFIVMMLLKA